MRFSRVWLAAAVSALAIALTGGAAMAATASPAPRAVKATTGNATRPAAVAFWRPEWVGG